MEYLKLLKGVDVWELPENSWITGVPFTTRRKENERALQHGVIDSGDGKVSGRTVELTIIVNEPTSAAYFATMDEIKRRLYRRDMRLYVTPSRYINLTSLYQFKEEFMPGLTNRMSTVSAEYKADDPFFYDEAVRSASITVTASPATLTVDNISNVDTPPVITVTATGALPHVKITNAANGRVCIYQDPQLIAGQRLVIDTAAATVKRNGVNTINAFSGTFHILEVGANVFTIECNPAATVNISYTPRWL